MKNMTSSINSTLGELRGCLHSGMSKSIAMSRIFGKWKNRNRHHAFPNATWRER